MGFRRGRRLGDPARLIRLNQNNASIAGVIFFRMKLPQKSRFISRVIPGLHAALPRAATATGLVFSVIAQLPMHVRGIFRPGIQQFPLL